MMVQEFDNVGRGYYFVEDLDKRDKSGSTDHLNAIDSEFRQPTVKDKANLLSSLCQDGNHRPVLDFDIPARYVPSTTEGHGHLYIDLALDWEKYEKLLVALADAGILEDGYVKAALRRKATFVRPEWVKKVYRKCGDCNGSGHDDDLDVTCAMCSGNGTLLIETADATPPPPVQVPFKCDAGCTCEIGQGCRYYGG